MPCYLPGMKKNPVQLAHYPLTLIVKAHSFKVSASWVQFFRGSEEVGRFHYPEIAGFHERSND